MKFFSTLLLPLLHSNPFQSFVCYSPTSLSALFIFADGWTLTGGLREGAFKRGPVASVVWPGLACLLFDFDASVSRTCAELSWGWGCTFKLSNPIGWCIVFLVFFLTLRNAVENEIANLTQLMCFTDVASKPNKNLWIERHTFLTIRVNQQFLERNFFNLLMSKHCLNTEWVRVHKLFHIAFQTWTCFTRHVCDI